MVSGGLALAPKELDEATRSAPLFAIDALRAIGPAGHRQIDFRGTYRLPVDRYSSLLFQSGH
jgi:hypothetical protein